MAEPNVYDLADAFRAAVLERERAAAGELVRAYGAAWQRIHARLDALNADIAAAAARGETVSPAWLLQQDRLQTLQRQTAGEILEFARFADSRIQTEQHAAILQAMQDAQDLLRASLGPPPPGAILSFAQLPAEAIAELVGHLQDGSPLSQVLASLGPEASDALRNALITGLATGQSPAAMVRSVREALGGNLMRALTIARTETLRSYREASRRTYQENSDVVEGWVWHASLSTRTCAFCWAMHGTVHRLDEQMATHPNCRCAEVPLTKTWEDLGFRNVPETRAQVQRGSDAFARLTPAQQEAVLGKAKAAAYQAGKLKLETIAGFRDDPRWGRVGFERSLNDVLGDQEARRWMASSRGIGGGGPSQPPTATGGASGGGRPDVVAALQRRGIDPTVAEEMVRLGDDLRARTAAQAVEFAGMVDVASGVRVGGILGGQRANVDIDPHFQAMRLGHSYVHLHTHPRSSAPSSVDGAVFVQADARPIQILGIIGQDQTWYLLSRRPGPVADPSDLLDLFERERQREFNHYVALVRSGAMTENEAWREQSHRIWTAIAPRLGLEYDRLEP